VIALLALATTAFAGDYYHPTDVSAASAQFQRAAQATQEPLGAMQDRLDAQAQALVDMELALDLLGERAPASQRERLVELRRLHARQRAVAQLFIEELAGDFDTAFSEALQRSLSGRTPEICRAQASIPGPRARASSSCSGTAINGALAHSMDSDKALELAVSELVSRPWPTVGLDASAARAVGPDGAPTLDITAWFRSAVGPRLSGIDHADEADRLPIEAAVEDGASAEQLERLRADAAAITAHTAAARLALSEPVLAAIEQGQAKGKLPPFTWCAQPELLGGCDATTAAPELGEALLASKPVRKALPK